MRHRNGGFKLGRNTSHRRAMLRNLVTSIILNDRVETTITKCKASRPIVEKMITLGKKGDVHSRRQALAYLMTDEAVTRLFTTVVAALRDASGRLPAHRPHLRPQGRCGRDGRDRTAGRRAGAEREGRKARRGSREEARRAAEAAGRAAPGRGPDPNAEP